MDYYMKFLSFTFLLIFTFQFCRTYWFATARHLGEQYIFAPHCEGFANQLYTFASIYGIGKMSNRVPVITADCQTVILQELVGVMDNFYRQAHYIKPPNCSEIRAIRLKHCCDNEMIRIQAAHTRVHKYFRIDNNALQSFAYFDEYRDEIRRLFECSPQVAKFIHRYNRRQLGYATRREIRKSNSGYPRHICVHTRRGDFLKGPLATTLNYTVPAIDRMLQREVERLPSMRNFTTFLLGADKAFLRELREIKLNSTYQNVLPYSVRYFIPHNMPRVVDMCYAVETCDTFLIASHASTFSRWIAYLMPPAESTIYYNPDFNSLYSPYSSRHFLSEWHQLIV